MISPHAAKQREFFTADRAAQYERRARQRTLWEAEDRLIRDVLADVPAGARVLDVPVGTGRFLAFYASRGFVVHGVDASKHMLAQAVGPGHLQVGDVFALPFEDQSFDVTLCVRLAHLIEHRDFVLALRELQRVTRSRIILTVRFGDEVHMRHGPERRRVLLDNLGGWRIARDVVIHGDWHLVELTC